MKFDDCDCDWCVHERECNNQKQMDKQNEEINIDVLLKYITQLRKHHIGLELTASNILNFVEVKLLERKFDFIDEELNQKQSERE